MDKKLWRNKLQEVKKNFAVDIESLKVDFPVSCNFKKCRGECCKDGVGIDIREMENIIKHKNLFIPLLSKHKRNPELWFKGKERDNDYPSGESIDTIVMDNNCIFQEKNSGCVLETAAMKQGLHRWTYKPFYCLFYPMVYDEGVIAADSWHLNLWCQHSQNHNSMILYTCREELTYVLGKSFYARMLKKAQTGKKHISLTLAGSITAVKNRTPLRKRNNAY